MCRFPWHFLMSPLRCAHHCHLKRAPAAPDSAALTDPIERKLLCDQSLA